MTSYIKEMWVTLYCPCGKCDRVFLQMSQSFMDNITKCLNQSHHVFIGYFIRVYIDEWVCRRHKYSCILFPFSSITGHVSPHITVYRIATVVDQQISIPLCDSHLLVLCKVGRITSLFQYQYNSVISCKVSSMRIQHTRYLLPLVDKLVDVSGSLFIIRKKHAVASALSFAEHTQNMMTNILWWVVIAIRYEMDG